MESNLEKYSRKLKAEGLPPNFWADDALVISVTLAQAYLKQGYSLGQSDTLERVEKELGCLQIWGLDKGWEAIKAEILKKGRV